MNEVKEYEACIPAVDPLYVEFGPFNDIEKVINTNLFYPIYIQGLSGNGKTLMVEQICAKLNRKIVRVNITKNTDEDDLFGGFRLIKGETHWFEGAVIKAMKEGAILLLDEVDLGSVNIMCLQPVLEGKGVLIKKTGIFVYPKMGFNIIATANTKGRGNSDGKYIGTNYLNEAFLERFSITFEQNYPSAESETEILNKVLSQNNKEVDKKLVENLIQFATLSRETYFKQGIDEVISTRRLVHIANAFLIYNDIDKAVELCLNRFDETVKMALMQFWKSCHADVKDEVKTESSDLLIDLDGLEQLQPL